MIWRLICLFLLFSVAACGNEVEVGDKGKYEEASGTPSGEHWPDYQPNISEANSKVIKERKEEYKEKKYHPDYREAYAYNPKGHYLGLGIYDRTCQEQNHSEKKKLNEDGVLMKMTQEGFKTTPVMSAQCGLMLYFYEDRTMTDTVQAYVNDILNSQDASGAFRYDFTWHYRSAVLEPGWASGMGQGQALSFFARILQDRDDPALRRAGERAIDFLITPVEDGGVMSTLKDLDPSLEHYIMFEEIVVGANEQNHVLNGYIFTLLGLYDWWHLDPEATVGYSHLARQYFEKGVRTLVKILPYYDMAGFSNYDMWHMTGGKTPNISPARYHFTHIYLLQAMYSITREPVIGHFLRRWSNEVGYFREYTAEAE